MRELILERFRPGVEGAAVSGNLVTDERVVASYVEGLQGWGHVDSMVVARAVGQ